MPRLFLAIDLPGEIKEQLCRLRTAIAGARWVPADQLHLTLAFLGDVEVEKMNQLIGKMAAIHTPAFHLHLGECGCFPNRKRPRVLWVGINSEPRLMLLADQVRKVALSCEIPVEERSFSPHVTLARIRQPVGSDCDAFLARTPSQESAAIPVNQFTLFESRLSRRGALHIPLRVFELTYPAE